ncbi:50S ribosomal protein L29 [bacterium]|nr:50S ribosomal protein L29 [bacterium]
MKDLANLDTLALKKMLADKQEALRMFRFGGAGGRARDTREGRTLRKEIAQILTALNRTSVAK